MKKKNKSLLFLLMGLFTAGLFFEMPLAKADPPPWAPAHGYRAKHQRAYSYYYYPAQQVYFSPYRNGYYYLNGGNWIFAPVLPPTIQLGNKVSISLGTPIPYSQHAYVVQQYPVVLVR